jgi:hypothetical protein
MNREDGFCLSKLCKVLVRTLQDFTEPSQDSLDRFSTGPICWGTLQLWAPINPEPCSSYLLRSHTCNFSPAYLSSLPTARTPCVLTSAPTSLFRAQQRYSFPVSHWCALFFWRANGNLGVGLPGPLFCIYSCFPLPVATCAAYLLHAHVLRTLLSTLKMEVICSSEVPLTFTTPRGIISQKT